ncbi:MAG: hypothetical protein IJ292_01625 [Clostridia bacterium]|nr:hypothetical protein [Clostridia bacterium]
MMKIMSRSKIAMMAVLVAVMMVVSMMAVSAAPVADAGVANDSYAVEYTGTTAQEAVDALTNAMKEVETSGKDVEFILKSDITLAPEEITTFVVGTDATSKGKLIVKSGLDDAGVPKFGIYLGGKAILHIKGNVQFKDVVLAKTATGTAVGDYKTASYVFVTEGKGVFGDAADTTKYGNVTTLEPVARATRVNVAGSDIEVYSGYYMAVTSNWGGSGTDIENPSIVIGGNADAEYLAGRGFFLGATPKVTGTSNVVIQDEANIYNIATAGYFRPEVPAGEEVNYSGNANLEMKGGTVQGLYAVGAALENRGTANFAVDENTHSQYKIDIKGGTINDAIAMFYYNKVMSFKGVDVTMNFGNANYFASRVILGPRVNQANGSISVTDCKVVANFDGAIVDSAFYSGAFIALGKDNAETDEVVFDIQTEVNIGANAASTFNGEVVFGTQYGSDKVFSATHKGNTVVNITAVNFTQGSFYATSSNKVVQTGRTQIKFANGDLTGAGNTEVPGGTTDTPSGDNGTTAPPAGTNAPANNDDDSKVDVGGDKDGGDNMGLIIGIIAAVVVVAVVVVVIVIAKKKKANK